MFTRAEYSELMEEIARQAKLAERAAKADPLQHVVEPAQRLAAVRALPAYERALALRSMPDRRRILRKMSPKERDGLIAAGFPTSEIPEDIRPEQPARSSTR